VDKSKRIRPRMPFRMGVVAGLLAVAANPDLDPGTSLGGLPAPGFRLVNQFGQPMSLRQSAARS
jgi:hypothetical protein